MKCGLTKACTRPPLAGRILAKILKAAAGKASRWAEALQTKGKVKNGQLPIL